MSDEIIQADRDAAVAYLKTNERYWIDRVSDIHSGKDDALVDAFASHRQQFSKDSPQ